MRTGKAIGWLLIIGAVGVLVPYLFLSISFDYPDILRQETSIILYRFHEGGSKLVGTWFFFALGGITLIPACILIGQKLEEIIIDTHSNSVWSYRVGGSNDRFTKMDIRSAGIGVFICECHR
jgi:hypothetical protein